VWSARPVELIIEIEDICFHQSKINAQGTFSPAGFKPNSSRITLSTFTLVHEMGHAMECSEWRRTGRGCGVGVGNIIKDLKSGDKKTKDKLITDDKRTEPEERSADAFAMFRANPKHLEDNFPVLFNCFKGNNAIITSEVHPTGCLKQGFRCANARAVRPPWEDRVCIASLIRQMSIGTCTAQELAPCGCSDYRLFVGAESFASLLSASKTSRVHITTP
jgi:hypothetical protein